jgi:AraC-like DNA-binding protein/mannose-6-phosphate isomerase-like protein (cupin superfamily)
MKTNNSKKLEHMTLPESGILAKSRHQRPDFSQKPHAHNYNSIMYIVSGGGTCSIEEAEHKLQADSVILLPNGLEHMLKDLPRKNMTVFSIYFDPSTAESNKEICEYLFQGDEPFTVPVYYAKKMRQTIRQILHEQQNRPAGYKLAIKQYLAQIMLQLYRLQLNNKSQPHAKKDDSQTRAKETLDHISKNYFETLSLPEAAKMAKLSQRQFSSMCKKITCKSFVQFVNDIRTEKAVELLTNTEAPVAAIAFEIGYEELSTFYRAFKKRHKVSPLKFRTTPK